MAIDRYESTFVVDINGNGDFTDLQTAINALPTTGGKIFVKAGVYPIISTIKITESNVQVQGEGMGITVFVGDSALTGNTPALEAFNRAAGTSRLLVADTARGVSPSRSLRRMLRPSQLEIMFCCFRIRRSIPNSPVSTRARLRRSPRSIQRP